MMKFKSIVFLASIILSVEYTFSQEDSAVLDTQYNQEEEMVEVIEEQTVFPGFYLGWSYLKPIGNYSKNKTATLKADNYNQNEIVKNLAGKSLGLAFELGYFYWLEDIKLPEEM